nr:MAG TPA: hypothetical protein [Caudoviricetes sp.]
MFCPLHFYGVGTVWQAYVLFHQPCRLHYSVSRICFVIL